MPDQNFINPLLNPILFPVLYRAVIFLFVGFVLILLLNKFSLSSFFSSKVGKIYIGWVILIPIYIIGVFLGGIPSLFVLFGFMYLAISEISKMADLPKAYKWSLYLMSFISIVVARFYTELFYSLPLIYFMIICFVAIRLNDAKKGLEQSAVTLFAAIWIVFGLTHAVLLNHLNNNLDGTKSLLLLVIFSTSLSDVGAYIFGRFFHKINFLDKYKIASNISPNKTYIGILGHVIGAAAGVWIMYFAIGKYLPIYQWVIATFLIGLFGLIGGLTNSMLKRYYGVKDSSHLIPGLGGVLDRIDSISRVVVVLYYFFVFVL